MLLKDALAIPDTARCICAVGAGGKTSLLYRLAEEYRQRGRRVLVVTTTKMYAPEKDGMLDKGTKEILEKLAKDGFVIAGTCLPEGKMGPLPREVWKKVCFAADVALVEADGSRRMPLKLPGEKEPVLPEECDFLVTVAGLSALGRSWALACHRFSAAAAEISEKEVTEKGLLRLVEKGYGGLWKIYPGCVFLNQADSIGWDRAEKIALGFSVPCAWGSLRENRYRRKEGNACERGL